MGEGTALMPGGTVLLISGADEILAAEAVRAAVAEAAGEADRIDVLDEYAGEDYTLDDVVIAASTPPMLATHRVVVARGCSRFGAAGIAPLIAWLSDPCPTTDLVLEWDSSPVPRTLVTAVEQAGGSHVASGVPGGARQRRSWIEEQLAAAAVQLDPRARASIVDHLGAELNRLSAVLETLAAVFGEDARLGADDIAPYLGAEGDVPPWELTDAIDSGNVSTTLAVLQRMWGADRHPLAVTASVVNHFTRMARLDGAAAANEQAAAALLGLRGSTFPARKALAGCRRRGTDGIARAVELLAQADVDMRGRSGLDARCVAEILCARLAAGAG
ncbi:DNA polymerase III subunit delta [Candidatus Poriferisodalis sp.]|uniref:DNA polymerase III subunit delta n=1 Tax=Candidatus Poriferisodalis sp. TaxID=3101277 RepID=UPI003B01F0CE